MSTRWLAALAAASWAATAAGAARGAGAGWTGGQPPATKSAGPAEERGSAMQQRPAMFDRGLGIFGAPGSAPDLRGGWRLEGYGRHRVPSAAPSYGEAAQRASGGGTTYQAWKSGDLARSVSSADVRAARGQQAPDLEWAGAPQPAAAAPYGVQYQLAQGRPRR